jgi:hypothetical protein
MRDAAPYAAPTPKVLYIHDDLSDYVSRQHGQASPAWHLTREFFALVCRDPRRVVLLTLESQMAPLLARGKYAPFALAIGIGRAGERVAQQLHALTGWFPKILRVDITREEDGRGGYNVVPTTGIPLAQQLPPLDTASSLAVVDDTVFSGLTMRTVPHSGLLPSRCRGVAGGYRGVLLHCDRVCGARALTGRGEFHQRQRIGDARWHSTPEAAAAGVFRASHVDACLVSRLCW